MIGLKRLKNLEQPLRVRLKIKSTRSCKRQKPKMSILWPRMKKYEDYIKKNKIDEKVKIIICSN